jgi:putative copper export protein
MANYTMAKSSLSDLATGEYTNTGLGVIQLLMLLLLVGLKAWKRVRRRMRSNEEHAEANEEMIKRLQSRVNRMA